GGNARQRLTEALGVAAVGRAPEREVDAREEQQIVRVGSERAHRLVVGRGQSRGGERAGRVREELLADHAARRDHEEREGRRAARGPGRALLQTLEERQADGDRAGAQEGAPVDGGSPMEPDALRFHWAPPTWVRNALFF